MKEDGKWIDFANLKIDTKKQIGGGSFGVVYKATITDATDRCKVVAKTFKDRGNLFTN